MTNLPLPRGDAPVRDTCCYYSTLCYFAVFVFLCFCGRLCRGGWQPRRSQSGSQRGLLLRLLPQGLLPSFLLSLIFRLSSLSSPAPLRSSSCGGCGLQLPTAKRRKYLLQAFYGSCFTLDGTHSSSDTLHNYFRTTSMHLFIYVRSAEYRQLVEFLGFRSHFAYPANGNKTIA